MTCSPVRMVPGYFCTWLLLLRNSSLTTTSPDFSFLATKQRNNDQSIVRRMCSSVGVLAGKTLWFCWKKGTPKHTVPGAQQIPQLALIILRKKSENLVGRKDRSMSGALFFGTPWPPPPKYANENPGASLVWSTRMYINVVYANIKKMVRTVSKLSFF